MYLPLAHPSDLSSPLHVETNSSNHLSIQTQHHYMQLETHMRVAALFMSCSWTLTEQHFIHRVFNPLRLNRCFGKLVDIKKEKKKQNHTLILCVLFVGRLCQRGWMAKFRSDVQISGNQPLKKSLSGKCYSSRMLSVQNSLIKTIQCERKFSVSLYGSVWTFSA